jgi:hypothetical protein
VFALMRTYNRRFAQIARRRRRLNLLGKTNRAHRCLANGFTLSRADIRLILKTVFRWALLELTEGWRSWSSVRTVASVSGQLSVGEKRSSPVAEAQEVTVRENG